MKKKDFPFEFDFDEIELVKNSGDLGTFWTLEIKKKFKTKKYASKIFEQLLLVRKQDNRNVEKKK